MNRKILGIISVIWFILVNLPQVVPPLNRIEPMLILPFNLLWILGLNFLMTVAVVWAFLGKGLATPDIDFDHLSRMAKDKGLMGGGN